MSPFTPPFKFGWGSGPDKYWDIHDSTGLRVLSITALLIDGSGGHKETNGIIRSREERTVDAKWILDTLNAAAAAP